MKLLPILLLLLSVPFLTACEPSFEDQCKADGHIYRDKSQPSGGYVLVDGQLKYVISTTTTRLCVDETTGNVLDVEVS